MNDHNLDDLIIDNIDPKNSKTKSFLTIIALAIVVLIVAIVFTKIILTNPNEKDPLEEKNSSTYLSPDLMLQDTQDVNIKEETITVEDSPSDTMDLSKLQITPTSHNNTIEADFINKSISKKQDPIVPKEEKKSLIKDILAEKKIAAQKVAKERAKIAAERKKQKAFEEKIKIKEAKAKAKKVVKVKKTSTVKFYIQVGSFSKTPSNRFLFIIKKSGFHYIMTPVSSGVKKLLIGPYSTRNAASNALVRVRDRINKSAFIVKR